MDCLLHDKKITLIYQLYGYDVIIDLNLNENLIPDHGQFLKYQSSMNEKIVQHFTKADIVLCHYTVCYF